MKNNLLAGAVVVAAALCVSGAQAQQTTASNSGVVSCLQGRLMVKEPKVVQVGPDRAMVQMKITNNLGWPVNQVYLKYNVSFKLTGNVVNSDPVSLYFPGGLASGGTTDVQTGFFGLRSMQEGLASGEYSAGTADKWTYKVVPASQAQAYVSVLDAPDQQGNQLVYASRIIGLGWTGRKSPQGCN